MTEVYTPAKWEASCGVAADPNRCAASVHDGGRGVGFHQCFRKGKHDEGGHRWCSQHRPSAEAKRKQEADAKYKAEWAERRKRSAREAARKNIADIAIKMFRQECGMDELEKAVIEYERLSSDKGDG